MKTSLAKLTAKIASMPRAELETLASGLVLTLYGMVHDADVGELSTSEAEELGVEPGEYYLDSEKEWTGGTVEECAEDVANARLNPEAL